MNPEKVVFGFFILLAATLNFGFCLGDFDNPAHHHPYELFAAIVVNLIATVLKLGDRTQLGALMLASSLVADVGLIGAAIAWAIGVWGTGQGMTPEVLGSVLSLASGALFANVVSVVLLIVETVLMRR
jgi:putative Ca2+/H+ antiporter (TMEM165/GDT1 family)